MYYNSLVIIILNSIFIYLFLLQYFDHPPSYNLNPVYPPTIISNVESECPKIIYQIVPDINDVPSGLYNTILHNIRMNPEFEYKIFDYNSALELLKSEFTTNVVMAFNATNSNQIKTDYFKYAVINKYGGIFVDIKYICYCKFIDLLKYNNVFHVQIRRVDDIELALLASHPNNPGVTMAFKKATTNLQLKNYCDSASKITGGTVIRDELFEIGYLSNFVKLHIDQYNIVRLKHNNIVVLKKYKSFDRENELYELLPNVLYEYNSKTLYGELVLPLIK
jgi:mannosyltransferase OCH1-like enzyme